jgi:transposase
MARSLSEDLRSRLVAAVKGGLSRRAAAARFGVSVATAVRWMDSWRRTGAVAARPQGGDRRSGRIEAVGSTILVALKAKVDLTLDELVELLRRRHGQRFARSTVWRFLDRHAMTVKKNGARSRAGQARRRRAARRVDRRAG